MLYLNAAETRAALPMSEAIDAMRHAFTGVAETPLRSVVGPSLVMPGTLDDMTAVKLISTVPGNPVGLVVVVADDGTPTGIVDGPTLTAIRTGAVSGLATSLLAREGATVLAMFGSGAMAFDQIDAVRTVRDIQRVVVWSRSFHNASRLADRVGGEPMADAEKASETADVISCATPAMSPLFSNDSVRSGTHVNAVGAFTPEMVELSADLVERAYVVVDDYEAAAVEAGDLIQAGRPANTDLRDLLAGRNPQIGEDVTVFKSVGVAAQDVAAAGRAIANAAEMRIGTELA